MTCCVTPSGTQTVILSCSATLTPITANVACVASILSGCPFTLAVDTKLESQNAASPPDMGGISAGGAAGSNVRIANAGGCFWTDIAAPCSTEGDEAWFRHPKPVRRIAVNSTH